MTVLRESGKVLSAKAQAQFVHWVIGRQLIGDERRGGWAYTPWIKGGDPDRKWNPKSWELPIDLAELEAWISSHPQDDLYFSPTIYRNRGGSRSDARASRVIHVDFDEVDPRQFASELQPTALWETSPHRWQGIYVTSAALEPDEFAVWSKKITYHFGADKGCWSINHVIRIPGRRNHKNTYGPDGARGGFWWVDSKKAVDLTDAAWTNIPDVETTRTALDNASPALTASAPVDAAEVIRRLPGSLRQMLRGATDDRSEGAHVAAKELLREGLTYAEVAAVLLASPIFEKFASRSDVDEQVKRELGKALGALEREGWVFDPVAATVHEQVNIDTDPFMGAGKGYTEAMLSALVAREVLAGRRRWVTGIGWHGWTGQVWEQVPEETVLEDVRRYVVARWEAALEATKRAETEEQKDSADRVVKSWKAAQSRAKLSAITVLTRGIEGIQAQVTDFDSNPDLLNAANGVVDLRTGDLRPHDPDLLMTRIAPATYRPGYRHPDWDQALEALPEDVREWVQLRYGQGCTGHAPPDDLLIFQEGGGANGKTTIVQGIKGALGNYYGEIPHRALMGDAKAHTTDLMVFLGRRTVVLEELPDHTLSVNRIKSVFGSETITARFIAKDNVTYRTTHTGFVNTNNLPRIEEKDHGTWRRLVRLRFPYTFRPEHEELRGAHDRRGDSNLRARLRDGEQGQHDAVLTWLVEGAVAWYQADRMMPAPPHRVQEDTRAWRSRNDVVLAYVGRRLAFDLESHVRASDLFDDFTRWLADEAPNRSMSKETFERDLAELQEVQDNGVNRVRQQRRTSQLSVPFAVFDDKGSGKYPAWRGIRFLTMGELMDS